MPDTVRFHRALQEGIDGGLFAGGVVACSRPGRPPVVVADGLADRERGMPCTAATPFDLASLTKVVVTTPVVAALVADGRLGLDDAVAAWVDGVDPRITVRHLLTHRAGLWEWQPLYRRTTTAADTVALISSLPLRYPPGEGFHYSDLSMMLLGAVAEQAGGESLDVLFRRLVADPVGMTGAGFVLRRPEGSSSWPAGWGLAAAGGRGDGIEREMAATGTPYPVWLDGAFDRWRTGTVRGEVNDGNAWWAMGGISGHAGLFATAGDVLRFGAAWLGRAPERIAPAAVVDAFLRPGADGHALGFRVVVPPPPGGAAFWHSGFTGTRLLLQPATGLVLVALTNRLHVEPDGAAGYPPDLTAWWDSLAGLCLGRRAPG